VWAAPEVVELDNVTSKEKGLGGATAKAVAF
jgi:hypothetical protein